MGLMMGAQDDLTLAIELMWLEDAETGHAAVKALLRELLRLLSALAAPGPDDLLVLAREYLFAAGFDASDSEDDRHRLLRVAAALGAAAEARHARPLG